MDGAGEFGCVDEFRERRVSNMLESDVWARMVRKKAERVTCQPLEVGLTDLQLRKEWFGA